VIAVTAALGTPSATIVRMVTDPTGMFLPLRTCSLAPWLSA
jgi:hypothetical protein